MRLVRGSVTDVTRDRSVTNALVDIASETGDPVVRVWTPPRQIAFGRRDTTADGYDRARAIAAERGYEPIERSVGGSAVAYTGGTVAFAHAIPIDGGRSGIDRRYRAATDSLVRALGDVGATVSRGEPDRSFCPGDHSIRGSGKIVGIAQRVRKSSALVGGCVIVRSSDRASIADVLESVYAELDIPFDPDSIGSVADAGGPDDERPVIDALEDVLTDGVDPRVVSAVELADGGP